ncbi:hypothetical protein RclHR1_07200004 [Rhizophagus clarus]|uniref:Uncharacterized protein n=1 Tax=Rhizophagus clarus TaxID=94130 RepID=A0A2Z6RVM9_9GLOM|nr:hypothetical protein RclHR1_07200004 [Rhizophagus clarus]GES75534.1 hypothetical protein RCL_jg9065.t1 [Rhizophagus clarus]
MLFTWTSNSYEENSTENRNFRHNDNYHFRDSSSDSSDAEMTTPSTPTTPVSPGLPNNDITFNNNNSPNMQRRASESITEAIQSKRAPARRYTLPGKLGLPLSRFWEAGRESSVQVAMENCQFGL